MRLEHLSSALFFGLNYLILPSDLIWDIVIIYYFTIDYLFESVFYLVILFELLFDLQFILKAFHSLS